MKVAVYHCSWIYYHSAFGGEVRLVDFMRAVTFYAHSNIRGNEVVQIASQWEESTGSRTLGTPDI